jgi:L-asparaginase II
VEWTVARDHGVQLTLTKVIVRNGQLPTSLHLGDVVVLDERGRTATQVENDLAALQALSTTERLPQLPLVDVFAADKS